MKNKGLRIRKSALSFILSFFMILSLIQFSTLKVKADGNVVDIFNDVIEGQWYVNAVQFVYDRGIMVGTSANTFGVSQKLQREQFAQILYSMAGKPAVAADAENPFKDVKNNPGYPRDAILWAYSEGIVAGNANGTFGVGQAIQRQAVAVMLYKYAQKFHYNLTTNDNALDGFDDKSNVANWALPSMKWAVTQGIISGKGNGKVDPAGNATRAECAAMIKMLIQKNNPQVGDIITFGKYEQDDNEANGKEDIDWIVLSVENDRMLLISQYALDNVPYHTSYSDITWENSYIRNWLNDDFINTAFSEEERSIIPTVKLKNENNPRYDTPGGNDTEDKIFCLSVKDTETYFGDYNSYDEKYFDGYNQRLICDCTQYAVNRGAFRYIITEEDYENTLSKKGYSADVVNMRTCSWWLRTPGGGNKYACIIGHMGEFGAYQDREVELDTLTVRPAIYVEY
ncbi:MAG: S-layer homology domain-containing protein [Lachnospiraceae bacterium]|nr:S-layer homology domain-containing protein [Lachnospiraceae bacterium]